MRDMRAIQANDSSSLPRATSHSAQMEAVVPCSGVEGVQWAPQIKDQATKKPKTSVRSRG